MTSCKCVLADHCSRCRHNLRFICDSACKICKSVSCGNVVELDNMQTLFYLFFYRDILAGTAKIM